MPQLKSGADHASQSAQAVESVRVQRERLSKQSSGIGSTARGDLRPRHNNRER